MAIKFFLLAALVAVANAGFIGRGIAVAPAIASYSSPAFYSSPITYHAPLAYHAPLSVTTVHGAPATAKTDAPKPAPAAKAAEPAPATKAAVNEEAEFDSNPAYSYSYDVQDAETGDTKTISESLENGVVKGSYSVVDPDGMKRTVEYTADAVNGFNAVVNTEPSKVVIKTPVAKARAPAPVAAKMVISAAPAFYHASPVAYHTAPVAYHAPITKVITSPVAKVVSSSPHSFSTYHSSSQPSTVTYHAAPVHHKIIY